MSPEFSHTSLSEKFRSLVPIKVALVGNPNSGKSTLFNALTGLNQKTGNFPGVTVDKKTGVCKAENPYTKKQQWFRIIDLPGTYSLYPKSLDEQVTFDVLFDKQNTDYPDIVIALLDSSNLKRNLLLATQLYDLKIPVVFALNMADLAQQSGINIHLEKLEQLLSVPVVSLDSRHKEGIRELKEKLFYATVSDFPFIAPEKYLAENYLSSVHKYNQQNSEYASYLKQVNDGEKQELKKGIFEKKLFKNFESRDTLLRFEKIKKLLSEAVTYDESRKDLTITDKIDNVATHPFWGFVLFLGVLFIIFQAIFYVAEFPMEWIEAGFVHFGIWLSNSLPQGSVNDLVVNGIVAGLSGVAVFIPQIALLFGFIAVLEDSGYMARVSFIMDKLMRKVGLNGRSVIPLVSGIACAVPAIMSTRTISNVKERLITILITPLMSCSARLPVYTLLISLMYPDKGHTGFFNKKGLMLMALYLIGFLAAIMAALIFKFFLKAREKSYFIMELPIYRL
ncbi:MAG: ferrous iron transport protein B, partial [Bacteroidia bacterium]